MQSTVAPQRSLPRPEKEGSPLWWQGRHIGDLLPNGTWRKVIDPRRHWCRKYDAPGIQAEVWDSLRARRLVRRIEVFDRVSGCVFHLTADDFARVAIRDTLNTLAGEQLFAPRYTWQVEHPEGYQHALQLP